MIKKIKIISFTKVILVLCFGACYFLVLNCEHKSGPSGKNFVEINFPLNKKCIYASAFCSEKDSSLIINYLTIMSLQFMKSTISHDTTYLEGIVEIFSPATFPSSLGRPQLINSGKITVSIDDKWILYQYDETGAGYNMFLKNSDTLFTDTTRLPTQFYNQFPVYPKRIIPNQEYSIYRPANEGVDWGFIGVYRHFRVHDFTNWEDDYGTSRGLSVTIAHQLGSIAPLEFHVIIDNHGLIASQHSILSSTITNPAGEDSVAIHVLSRRIEDYTAPETLHELSWYIDEVTTKGFKLVNE